MAQFLLERGASLHVRDAFGRSPLIDAVERKHVGIVKLFRRAGAHLRPGTLVPVGAPDTALSSSSMGPRRSSQSESGPPTTTFGVQMCVAVWNRDFHLIR